MLTVCEIPVFLKNPESDNSSLASELELRLNHLEKNLGVLVSLTLMEDTRLADGRRVGFIGTFRSKEK